MGVDPQIRIVERAKNALDVQWCYWRESAICIPFWRTLSQYASELFPRGQDPLRRPSELGVNARRPPTLPGDHRCCELVSGPSRGFCHQPFRHRRRSCLLRRSCCRLGLKTALFDTRPVVDLHVYRRCLAHSVKHLRDKEKPTRCSRWPPTCQAPGTLRRRNRRRSSSCTARRGPRRPEAALAAGPSSHVSCAYSMTAMTLADYGTPF
jgi:hypothetical protein